MNMFDLKGKVAIVTGAYAGLGYDMASVLAEAGCHVVLTSRKAAKTAEASSRIAREHAVETLGLPMDQCSFAEVSAMAEKAWAWKNRIDILINNAGGGSGSSEGDFMKRAPEDMESLIMTNLVGAMFCCRAVGEYMIRQGSGKIINIGSIAGIVGRDRRMYRDTNKMEQPVDYAAAKAGVIGMTRDLAAYMAPHKVTVNCLSPGGFDKGDLPEAFVNAYSSATPLNRMGRMGCDIKGMALFLSSPASDYVTGQNFVIDGGFSSCK